MPSAAASAPHGAPSSSTARNAQASPSVTYTPASRPPPVAPSGTLTRSSAVTSTVNSSSTAAAR